jgi:hypothetical protein
VLLRGDDFEDALLFVTCGAHVEAVGRAMRQQAEQVGQAAQAAQVGPVVQAVRNTGDGRSSGEGGEGKGGPEVGVSESVSVEVDERRNVHVSLLLPSDLPDLPDGDKESRGREGVSRGKIRRLAPHLDRLRSLFGEVARRTNWNDCSLCSTVDAHYYNNTATAAATEETATYRADAGANAGADRHVVHRACGGGVRDDTPKEERGGRGGGTAGGENKDEEEVGEVTEEREREAVNRAAHGVIVDLATVLSAQQCVEYGQRMVERSRAFEGCRWSGGNGLDLILAIEGARREKERREQEGRENERVMARKVRRGILIYRNIGIGRKI